MKTHNNWEEKKLSELFEIETGTTPSTRTAEYWGGGTVNWITPTDLSHNEGKAYISGSERKVTRKALKENNLTMLPKKALILSTRAPVGYVAVLENEAVFNQGCKGLVPKTELSPEFYYYCLISKQKLLDNRSSGSTFKELAKDVLEKVELPFPPLPEQKRIVEILSGVDERIKKTEQRIENIEKIKTALSRKLFDDSKFTQKVNLGDRDEFILIMGQSPDSETYNNQKNGMPFLQGKADFGQLYPQIYAYTTQPCKIAQVDDILISVRAPVGDVNVANCEVCLGRGLSGIRVLKGNTLFYFYWLQKNRKFIENLGAGAIFKAITKDQLENIEVPLATVPQQKEIAEKMSHIDARIRNEKGQKEKLERIKKSLMNDLLSGRKRVTLP